MKNKLIAVAIVVSALAVGGVLLLSLHAAPTAQAVFGGILPPGCDVCNALAINCYDNDFPYMFCTELYYGCLEDMGINPLECVPNTLPN
jgi:hypothetical protein